MEYTISIETSTGVFKAHFETHGDAMAFWAILDRCYNAGTIKGITNATWRETRQGYIVQTLPSFIMGKDEAKLLVQNRTPYNKLRSGGRQGGIKHTVTASEITAALGFAPNMQPSSDGKVRLEWQWKAPNGQICSVWDYKGARWSFYGPKAEMETLFGAANVYSG